MKKLNLFILLTGIVIAVSGKAQKLVPHYVPTTGLQTFLSFEPYGFTRNFAHESEFLMISVSQTNTPIFQPNNTFGYTTTALELSGTGGLYKQAGQAYYTPTEAISCGAYVKFKGTNPNVTSGSYNPAIIAYDRGLNDFSSNGQAYSLMLEEDQASTSGYKLVAGLYTNAGLLTAEYSNFPLDSMVHIALSWSATSKTLDLFIDGSLVNSEVNNSATSIDYNSGTYFLIGGTSLTNLNTCFNGSIDDLFLYDRKLSSTELASLVSRNSYELFYPLNGTLTPKNQPNLTLNSSATVEYNAVGQSGFNGDSCLFDDIGLTLSTPVLDSSNQANFNTTADLFPQSFTTALWLNLDSINISTYSNFIELGYAYFFRLINNSIQFGYRNSYIGGNYAVYTSNPIERGKWMHLAVTSTITTSNGNRQFVVYQNGEVIDVINSFLSLAESYIEYDLTEDYALSVKSRFNNSALNSFGNFQDVYFSNKPLSDCEIQELYTRNKVFYNATDTILHATLDSNLVWINCDNNSVVSTNKIFSPTENGNYACVYQNNCSNDTTDCIYVQTTLTEPTSTTNFTIVNSVEVFPNPSSTNLYVNTSETCQLMFYDVTGKAIETHILQQQQTLIPVYHLKNGIYFLKFTSNNGETTTKKVVINH